MFEWLKRFFEAGPDLVTEALQNKGSILDVRSPQEFKSGTVKGAINIPHTEIQQQKKKLKTLSQPIIVCCASGMRSSMAIQDLNSIGLNNVVNGKTVGKVAKAQLALVEQ